MIQVRKNNGQVVTFDGDKIERILVRVGLDTSAAHSTAQTVQTWAGGVPGGIVTTSEIKKKVLELLPPEAAQKIRAFVKQRRPA